MSQAVHPTRPFQGHLHPTKQDTGLQKSSLLCYCERTLGDCSLSSTPLLECEASWLLLGSFVGSLGPCPRKQSPLREGGGTVAPVGTRATFLLGEVQGHMLRRLHGCWGCCFMGRPGCAQQLRPSFLYPVTDSCPCLCLPWLQPEPLFASSGPSRGN